MATKKATLAKAKARGVLINDEAECARIYADAPSGHQFSGTMTHCVVADYEWAPKSEAWDAIVRDMEHGIEPCPEGGDSNCRDYGCPAWKEAA